MLRMNLSFFGGRGAKSSVVTKSRFPNYYSDTPQPEPTSTASKGPKYGAKVQQDFIDYVKYQINVDLTKARDTKFDNRKGFNIDTRDLTRNEWNQFRSLIQRYPNGGGFDVQVRENGAYREKIFVTRK